MGASDGQLNNPYGVAVHCNKVYVADNRNKCIPVFQVDGKFCISFGSDQLVGPCDVAVSADDHLLVVDHYHCIHIFTLDGHYVGKFSTNGSGRGQLNSPSAWSCH